MNYFKITLCNHDVIRVYYNERLEIVSCNGYEGLKIDNNAVKNVFDFRRECKLSADTSLALQLIVEANMKGFDIEGIAILMGPTANAISNICINYKDLARDLEEIC